MLNRASGNFIKVELCQNIMSPSTLLSSHLKMNYTDFNPEVHLSQHSFLKALTTPDIWAIVQGVLSRSSSVLLVPEKKAIEGLQIDDLFALTHCAFLNPLNPSEMVTANGLVALSVRTPGGAKQLWVVSDKGKVNTKDPTQTFDVIRPLYTHFSHDGKSLQNVSILGEAEVVVNKRTIHTIVISAPVDFPGSPWKRLPAGSFDSLIDFASEQRHAQMMSPTGVISKPMKNGKPTPGPSAAGMLAPVPKIKTGADEASFLARLKSAPEVQASLTAFISKFSQQPPIASEQGAIVRNYLDEVVGLMLHHRAWANATDEDVDIAVEAVEKYVMQKIYKFCFSSTTEDITRDKHITNRFNELQFITQDHLEIPLLHRDAQRTNQAIEELRQMSATKTPRGKLIRILNCCKAIYSILNRAAQQGAAAGADEFVPILNYVVLHANPPQIHSNIQYILRFRAPNKLISEAGYYFTHLESTVAWLENVEPSKLTIDPDTFHSLLKQTQESLADKAAQKNAQNLAATSAITPTLTSTKPTYSYASPAHTSTTVRSPSTDLLDLSGLGNSIPTSPSPSLASPLLSDLVWHHSPSPTSTSGSLTTSSLTSSMIPSMSPTTSFSRASSGSRSVTRDDDSSEASVLEIQDSESPLRFLNYNHVWDVRVGELEDLFQAYRMLAHENFQLRTDLYKSANKLGPN